MAWASFERGTDVMRQRVIPFGTFWNDDVDFLWLLLQRLRDSRKPLLGRLDHAMLSTSAHKRRMLLHQLVVAAVKVCARIDHLLPSRFRQLIRTECKVVTLQELELVWVCSARILDLGDQQMVGDRFAQGRSATAVTGQDICKGDMAPFRGRDINLRGDCIPERVLAPEVRCLGAAAIALVDGVTRFVCCACE